MYTLRTEQSFDSAHFLYKYDGKCSNIHGHRWKVIIEIRGKELNKEGQEKGMLVDFGRLKSDLKEEIEDLDHSLIIEEESIKSKLYSALMEDGFKVKKLPYRPTAENMAYYFFMKMKNKGYDVKNSIVYETPNNCASYSEE